MTTDSARFRGIFANMPTTLTADGNAVDEPGLRDHVTWALEQGVHGVSCLLTMGWFTYLTAAERNAVVRCVVEAVDGAVPVIAGVSADTTAETIDLAKEAAAAGADCLLVQPRSYMPLRPWEVLAHYEAVAEAIDDAPIGVYNHPKATGVTITPQQHAEIVERTGAVAAKDSSVPVTHVREVLRRVNGPYGYLWPNVEVLPGALALGAPGCCTGVASVLPREVLAIYEAATAGDDAAARDALDRMLGIVEEFQAVGSSRAVRAVAEIRGLPVGGIRRPLASLPEPDKERLAAALAEAGIGPA